MDQGPLVTEQIEAGEQFLLNFNRTTYAPIRVAFWLKESEDGEWFLYLASDRINDSNFDLAYGEVLRVAGKNPNPWLDPFQMKVIGADDALAKALLEIQRKYPNKVAVRLRNCHLGSLNVDEVYIYPSSLFMRPRKKPGRKARKS